MFLEFHCYAIRTMVDTDCALPGCEISRSSPRSSTRIIEFRHEDRKIS